MINTNANAVSAPTPGCVCNRCASGHFSTSCSIACVSSAIVGVSRSSNSSRSRRRRLAHGANANRLQLLSSRYRRLLQRSPSLSATAYSWFMIRVRACTIRCRCHSRCRRSRFSPLGTQICGKRSSNNNRKISSASWRSVFCLRTRFVRISAASPIHNSNRNLLNNRSNQRAYPPSLNVPPGLRDRGKTFPPSSRCSNRRSPHSHRSDYGARPVDYRTAPLSEGQSYCLGCGNQASVECTHRRSGSRAGWHQSATSHVNASSRVLKDGSSRPEKPLICSWNSLGKLLAPIHADFLI